MITMKAVVMAGGLGTRLRPLTYIMAKPTVPIAGNPCIYYNLKSLADAGINDIIITSGYRVDDIMKVVGRFSETLDLNIIYSYEYVARGTAGGVKKVEAFLEDTFLVTSGDVLCDIDFAEIVRYHRKKNAFATMALSTVDNPSEYGIVGLDSEGRITRFKEKPKPEEAFSNLINAGIYVLEPEVLDYIPKNTEFDFSKHTFPRMLADGRDLYGIRLKGLWKDIGRPRDLIDANYRICKKLGKLYGNANVISEDGIPSDIKIIDAAYIAQGCTFAKDSVVERGYIHEGVSLSSDVLVKDTILLENTTVGHSTKIVNSILGPGVKVGNNVRIENSIIVSGIEIQSGTEIKGIRYWEGGLSYREGL